MRILRKDIRNICVIQLKPFGDVFLTTSYFKALKEFYPRARLTYLMKEPYQNIVLDHPYIDRIITIKKAKGIRYVTERISMFRRLRNEKFDLVIDQQNMPSSQVLAFMTGAPYRLGYKSRRVNYDFLYTHHAAFGPDRYSAAQKFDIVKPLGMTEKPCSLLLTIPASDERAMGQWLSDSGLRPEKLLILSPGSSYHWKKWPESSFAELADRLSETYGFKTLIVWGPGEKDTADRVAALMKSPCFVAPPTTFQQVGALLKRAAFLVCNDNSISHLSVATGIRTLTVFGLTDSLCWSPSSVFKTHRHVRHPSPDIDDPGFGVTVSMVFDSVKRWLTPECRP